jgi:aspartyl-tRNA(Asn)/glutamyl-tRNA(Gln) amidotransferase subunit B
MKSYTPTIGIEVHAELRTKSKMFCGCPNDPHAAEPNQNICPVCLAHPGTLPTVNKQAVEHILLVGEALGGTLANFSEFDRKHYFYPDIPKAYQLSQYAYPFVTGGELAGVAITRVHLEEDTARSQHSADGTSLVDFNRAGVPLMELVTEPVIHDAETAGAFARELQLLLRTLGVSDANLEKGEMRVEANISVSPDKTLGTKVEVKNLNSFKSVEQSILYEVKRQIEALESGRPVVQETRGWDEQKSRTFSQRVKETAEDYRYFPDPDIPKYDRSLLSEWSNSRLHEMLPKLPNEIRTAYRDLGLADEQIEIILFDAAMRNFFAATVSLLAADTKKATLAANYLTSDIVGLLQQEDQHDLGTVEAAPFAALVTMVAAGEITSRVAKDLLPEVVFAGKDPQTMASEQGLLQQNSSETLAPIVAEVLAEHTGVADEYRSGKEAALQYLVGQVMKATKGSANPAVVKELLQAELS